MLNFFEITLPNTTKAIIDFSTKIVRRLKAIIELLTKIVRNLRTSQNNIVNQTIESVLFTKHSGMTFAFHLRV